MKVYHKDSAGKEWAFSFDCSLEEGRAFQKILAGVRGVRGTLSLRLSNYLGDSYAEAEGVDRFCEVIEREILQHLKELHPVTGEEDEQTELQAPDPPKPRQVCADPADNSERRAYYWENF